MNNNNFPLNSSSVFEFAQMMFANAEQENRQMEEEQENQQMQEEDAEILQIQNDDDEILRYLDYQQTCIAEVGINMIATLILHASIAMPLINQDIFYEIYISSPLFIAQSWERHSYWTSFHPSLSDEEEGRSSFKAHYRITLETFNNLIRKLSSCEEYMGSQLHGGFPLFIQVATVLWRFANSTFGFRVMEMTLGIKDGSYNNFTNRFVDAMKHVGEQVITWPVNDHERALEIANGFRGRGTAEEPRLSGVIGAIDGKLVVIHKPASRGNLYVDRKNRSSMSLLAVCDHRTKFMMVKTGDSGRVHDARAFRESNLYSNIINIPDQICPADTYIIADSAFPLLPRVITPFSGSDNPGLKRFNKILSRTRIKIEHAFGSLTMRWRTLWIQLYMLDIPRIAKTIYACCVLHNMCIDGGDIEDLHDAVINEFNSFVNLDPRVPNETVHNVELVNGIDEPDEPAEPGHDVREIPNREDLVYTRLMNGFEAEGVVARQRLLEAVVPRDLWDQQDQHTDGRGERRRGRGRRDRGRGERGRGRGRARRATRR
ncbi:hypothetical protein INT45_010706 [Circinella minor]|uniref:DDE Tnp4 domain-containing protein n=1 Tax=Circinella minor TaxID=1195481 RepID=A0A8H7VBD9_9FUNG|nr:hypothetical protein INT45_010706 [Circinella minor]